jgi:GNAT superfamily N-acetyltransferase
MVQLRVMGPPDADAFRRFRIDALEESPLSFGSNADGEREVSPAEWASRLSEERGTVVGAFTSEGVLVGTVGAYFSESDPHGAGPWLWTMYVAPAYRRRGIAKLLIHEVLRCIRSRGDQRPVRLRVTEASVAARRVYQELGFVVTGQETGVPWHSGHHVNLEYMTLIPQSDA